MSGRLAVSVQEDRKDVGQDSQLLAGTHLTAGSVHPQSPYSARDDRFAVLSPGLVIRVNPDTVPVTEPLKNFRIVYLGASLELGDGRLSDDIVTNKAQGFTYVGA